ncbi:MAG: cyclic pyranopterin monophosphate synthase MoaC [Verrucomicrobiales bacterium]
MSSESLSHIDESNRANMVDVSAKSVTVRTATAEAKVHVNSAVSALFDGHDLVSKKGPVFQTAILAGIMGAKQTSQLIPLCHPLPLDSVKIDIQFTEPIATIRCTAKTTGKTGVEMEALTGANLAALTLYDMCKALDKAITITEVRLIEKTGGASDFSISS